MGYNDNKVFNPRLSKDNGDVDNIEITTVDNGNTEIQSIDNIQDSRGILSIIDKLNIKIDNPNRLNYLLSYIGDNYPIDKDNDKDLEERLSIFMYLYTKYDYTPFMVNFASFCGVAKETLTSWGNGEYRVGSSHCHSVKKCREFCESALVVDGMSARNPAMQIFLLKNNHGYKDQVDIAAVQSTAGQPDKSIEQILKEYTIEGKTEPPSADF